jgi:hypothetical protein
MTTISVICDSALPPAQVLASAHDFSQRRAEVFPAVEVERLEVHERGDASADVTEGTGVGPLGVNWERCRYDWSQPGAVTATVTDSNLYASPGSSWEIKATAKGEGSQVSMVWARKFKPRPKGILFGTAFRIIGKPIFRRYARDVIENLDQLDESATPIPVSVK